MPIFHPTYNPEKAGKLSSLGNQDLVAINFSMILYHKFFEILIITIYLLDIH